MTLSLNTSFLHPIHVRFCWDVTNVPMYTAGLFALTHRVKLFKINVCYLRGKALGFRHLVEPPKYQIPFLNCKEKAVLFDIKIYIFLLCLESITENL